MRKFLSHAFVLGANYYLLVFLLGLGLVAATEQQGPWSSAIPVLVVVLAFVLALAYQLTRSRWRFQTVGEQLLGSTSKTTILAQEHGFTVSRVPLLGLMLLTLALNGNLEDGLTNGTVYTIADVMILAVIWFIQFYAFRSFIDNPGMVPIVTLAAMLFGLGLMVQCGYRKLVSEDLHVLAGHYLVGVYKGLAVLWLIVGFYYQKHYRLWDKQ